MKINQTHIAMIPGIIVKEINREASALELEILNAWLVESDENQRLYQKLRQKETLAETIRKYDHIDRLEAWEKVLEEIDKKSEKKKVHFINHFLKYAVILLIPVAVATYFLFHGTGGERVESMFAELEQQVVQLKESSLIMADGKIVDLQTSSDESLVEIDGTKIAKEDSVLHYQGAGMNSETKDIQYNSLVTPASKVFTIVLSDGTKVWLNAKSAIRYPTCFESDIRKVYLTGEAYFEVKRDTLHPFVVSTREMDVEVLGTVFNVMAYPEEKAVETTLVSGKVKVKTLKSELLLLPGMQAQFDKQTASLEKHSADTEIVSSWRFGKYVFKYEDLECVMSKLSRWYNIEVSFSNQEKKSLHFSGTLHKYDDIDKTLKIIELATDVKFSDLGNKIVVN